MSQKTMSMSPTLMRTGMNRYERESEKAEVIDGNR
jgi:hypothetical protein